MVKVVIPGIGGRMGRELTRVARASEQAVVSAGTERDQEQLRALRDELGVPVEGSLQVALEAGADVVIDFTSPAATASHAAICAEAKVPMVIGTTGLGAEERAALEEASKRIPMVFAPNMSVGMNLLFRLVAEAAKALPDYDVEIVEAHHRYKKDAPSGSALGLAEWAARAREVSLDAVGSYGRHGLVGERPAGEIGVHAIRGGDVAGDHTVLFLGDGERLELGHRASSRDAFASGAMRAALWVVGKTPGLYSMQDVLGFDSRS